MSVGLLEGHSPLLSKLLLLQALPVLPLSNLLRVTHGATLYSLTLPCFPSHDRCGR